MSILIKGMEMPTDDFIRIILYPNGRVVKANAVEYEEFEAIPIPPHGRLIDARKMQESIKRQTGFLKLMGGELPDIAEILENGFLQEIANAPTIIEAEEGE